MSSQKKNHEHIFKNLKEYMFTSENMLRYMCADNIHPKLQNKQKKKKVDVKTQMDVFYPYQKDELFWCFLIALKGLEFYKFSNEHTFTYEKEFKINSVEKLREKKDILKQKKIKLNQVEDELVNKSKISLTTLHSLCIVYNISLLYVWGKKYCDFKYGDKLTYIIITDDFHKKIGLKECLKEEDIKIIQNTYWYIENPFKPMRAISAYSIKELHKICEKLEIPIINSDGKKMNKKTLYENIMQKI